MLPFNGGLDLSRLNALRQAIYGGGGTFPTPTPAPMPMPVRGGPVYPTPTPAPAPWGGNPPVANPIQFPIGGGNQYPNLMALRALAPQIAQSNLRYPMTRQY